MRTLYLVQEINWNYDDQWFYEDGETPRKAFADRAAAEAFRAAQENVQREKLIAVPLTDKYEEWSGNLVVTFGGVREVSSLPADELDNRLAALGVPPLPKGYGAKDWNNSWWRALWETRPTVTERDPVWRLFDKVRFYEIVEVEAEV